MIGKIPKAGRGFKGLVNYLLNGALSAERHPLLKDRVLWTETHNLLTRDPKKAVRIMRATANKSRRCESPVYHFVISWTPEEKPGEDLKRRIVADTCTDLGLSDHQRVVIAHDDTRHAHVHVVINRVHPDTGKAWNRQQDWVRLEQSLARQAHQHGLLFVPGRHNAELLTGSPRKARDPEYQKARREKQPLPLMAWSKQRIAAERTHLVTLFTSATSWDGLTASLAKRGLSVERKGQGHVLRDDTSEVKLSQLSKDVRITTLERKFKAPWQPSAAKPNNPSVNPKPRKTIGHKPHQIAPNTPPSGVIPKHPQDNACKDRSYVQSLVDDPALVTDHNPIETHQSVSKPPPLSPRRKRLKGPKL